MPPTSETRKDNLSAISLEEVASWTPGIGLNRLSEIRVSIPALQRGLVWTPQQNELLWDSILRGFPIGALVVTNWSERLKKSAEKSADEDDARIKYHLLDGQQRCHAIAMGFSDPFSVQESKNQEKVEIILWLDLKPDQVESSTRNFWIRATTTAHPWGYSRNDEATPLNAEAIRGAITPLGLHASDPNYRRPSPKVLWPCKAAAQIPVPLSWLLKLPLEDEAEFWKLLAVRAAEAKEFQWAQAICDFCAKQGVPITNSRIFQGIRQVRKLRLVALEAPVELLEDSVQEDPEQKKIPDNNREDVSNIEQLFHRLNRQGTKLDGEELSYSMIKAYWPDLEGPINEVAKHRMPQARMVSLAVRAALAHDENKNLPGTLTVSALRVIARKKEKERDLIQSFILNELNQACTLVDDWLKYHPISNPCGLLPVHLTSIAINSRDVYLLLIYFAKQMAGRSRPEGWNQTMQGLATVLHWFSVDKTKAVNCVYDQCRSGLSFCNINNALKEATKEGFVRNLHTPEAAEAFIQIPISKIDFEKWNWWLHTSGSGTDEVTQIRRSQWWEFLAFRHNREMLLYAQRQFLARRFPEYDPARRDLWEDLNRPWDFDHILASKCVQGRKGGVTFREISKQWIGTIGNLRAWAFEDNRSDQARTAKEKIKDNQEWLKDSFLETEKEYENEIDGFSGGDGVRHDKDVARAFVEACRGRLIRIYREWYGSVGIARLIGNFEEIPLPSQVNEAHRTNEPAALTLPVQSEFGSKGV